LECLPKHFISAETVNIFKNHVVKSWSDQEVLYMTTTEISTSEP